VHGEFVVPSAAVSTAAPAIGASFEADIHAPGMRPANYARNALHVTSATSALAILELAPSWAVTIAAAVAALGVTLELSRRASPAINAACMAVFGRTAHAHEAHRVNSATWYAVAVLLMALCEQTVPAAIALVTLGVGDPIAAIVGRRFGRTRLVSGRTLEGSLAFVVSASLAAITLVSIVHPGVAPARALIAVVVGALAGSVAELFSRRIDDNFSIPLASFAAAYLALLAV
jgi:dolichol kinase